MDFIKLIIKCIYPELVTGELSYEIFCLGHETDHVSLWDKITSVGNKYGMEFSSTRSIAKKD